MIKKMMLLVLVLFVSVSVSGCFRFANQRQAGAAWQAGTTAAGALAGQIIGRNTESTLIGAGVGYVVGGLTKEFLVFPTHNDAAIAAVKRGGSVNYQVQDVPGKNYTARVIRMEGNCQWVEEAEWENGQVVRKWVKKVCRGNTPYQPSAPKG